MKRTVALLATAAFLAAACAGSTEKPDRAVQDPGDHLEENAPHEGRGKNGSKNDKKQPTPNDESPDEASAAAGDGEVDDGNEDRDEGASTDGSTATRNKSTSYPASGTYTFAQSGYEEFCDSAARCDRERLPARQRVRLVYETRNASSAIVVSEQKASKSRLSRTWVRYTPSGAHITKVYIRFEYSGFGLERTYVPEPPVEALRFPLQAGSEWSGRWRASTSGSYEVTVGKERRIAVRGRDVVAYPVRTTTEFRGDFDGKSRITTYVDRRSKAVIAAEGVLNVTSQFGRYTTVFETRLSGGPGY